MYLKETSRNKEEVDSSSNSDNVITNYFKSISNFRPLTREQESNLGRDIQLLVKALKLLKEFKEEEVIRSLDLKDKEQLDHLIKKCKKSYERLVESNLRLVIFISKRYINKGLSLEDLIQEGNLGLFKACMRFDPDYGTKLSTYAVPWIKNAIQVAIKKQSLVIYRPHSFNIELAKIIQATKELTKEKGKPPRDLEIARRLNIKPSRLRQVRLLTQNTLSLDTKIKSFDLDNISFLDLCKEYSSQTPEEYVDTNLLQERVKEALEYLDEEEKAVITLRFGLFNNKPQTINEVSAVINRTKECIRQLENRAIEKLRWQGKLNDFE